MILFVSLKLYINNNGLFEWPKSLRSTFSLSLLTPIDKYISQHVVLWAYWTVIFLLRFCITWCEIYQSDSVFKLNGKLLRNENVQSKTSNVSRNLGRSNMSNVWSFIKMEWANWNITLLRRLNLNKLFSSQLMYDCWPYSWLLEIICYKI